MNFNAVFSQPYKFDLKFGDNSYPATDFSINMRLINQYGNVEIPQGFTRIQLTAPIMNGKITGKQAWGADFTIYDCGRFNAPITPFLVFGNVTVSNAAIFNQPMPASKNLSLYRCPEFDSSVSAINGNLYVQECAKFNKPLTFGANQWNFQDKPIRNLPKFNSSIRILANNALCQYMFNADSMNSEQIRKGSVYIEGGNCDFMFENDKHFDGLVEFGDSVTSCAAMFYGANKFNQPIEIPSAATNLYHMFYNASEFNHPVSIGNCVTDCSGMFSGASNFDREVSLPSQMDGETNCSHMFYGSKFNRAVDIPKNVTDCMAMFAEDHYLNSPVTIPNTVTQCGAMFNNATWFNQPVNIPASVVNCREMFRNAVSLNKHVEIASGVEDGLGMFWDAKNYNQDTFIQNSFTNIEGMFGGVTNITGKTIFTPARFNNSGGVDGWSANANNCITWYGA